MKAVITIDGMELIVFNNHIKPAAVAAELSVLQGRIQAKLDLESRNIIVLGDLNAGGATLSGGFERHDYLFNEYDGWYNVFTDDDHTTFAEDTKSYDRMILSESMYPHYAKQKGIIGHLPDRLSFEGWEGERRISDHRLIWAKFNITPDEIVEEYDHTYTAMGAIIDIVVGERLWRRNP